MEGLNSKKNRKDMKSNEELKFQSPYQNKDGNNSRFGFQINKFSEIGNTNYSENTKTQTNMINKKHISKPLSQPKKQLTQKDFIFFIKDIFQEIKANVKEKTYNECKKYLLNQINQITNKEKVDLKALSYNRNSRNKIRSDETYSEEKNDAKNLEKKTELVPNSGIVRQSTLSNPSLIDHKYSSFNFKNSFEINSKILSDLGKSNILSAKQPFSTKFNPKKQHFSSFLKENNSEKNTEKKEVKTTLFKNYKNQNPKENMVKMNSRLMSFVNKSQSLHKETPPNQTNKTFSMKSNNSKVFKESQKKSVNLKNSYLYNEKPDIARKQSLDISHIAFHTNSNQSLYDTTKCMSKQIKHRITESFHSYQNPVNQSLKQLSSLKDDNQLIEEVNESNNHEPKPNLDMSIERHEKDNVEISFEKESESGRISTKKSEISEKNQQFFIDENKYLKRNILYTNEINYEEEEQKFKNLLFKQY